MIIHVSHFACVVVTFCVQLEQSMLQYPVSTPFPFYTTKLQGQIEPVPTFGTFSEQQNIARLLV